MADSNFINGIKIACGLLVTLLFGSCTMLIAPSFFQSLIRGDADSFGFAIVVFFGLLPTMAGLALIVWGVRDIRTNRARKSSRMDSPTHRGRARDRTDDQP